MLEFDVTPDGADTFRVVADSRVISLWERILKERSLGMLQGSGVKMSHLEEVAHLAAKKAGRFDDNLNAFREQCQIMPINPDAEESDGDGLDPTPADL